MKPNLESSGRTARSAGASAPPRQRSTRVTASGGAAASPSISLNGSRAKNALALAQSIVRLTRGENVKTYIQAVEGRINALARVHTILSLSNWQGAKIGKLVDEELAPYSTGDQIAFCGSDIQLQPATAQTLALALHELVTNSAKYGALSTLAGRLTIKWEIQ